MSIFNKIYEQSTKESSYVAIVCTLLMLYMIDAMLGFEELIYAFSHPSTLWAIISADSILFLLLCATFFRNINVFNLCGSFLIFILFGRIVVYLTSSQFEVIIFIAIVIGINLIKVFFAKSKKNSVFSLILSLVAFSVGFILHQMFFFSALNNDLLAKQPVFFNAISAYQSSNDLNDCEAHNLSCIKISRFAEIQSKTALDKSIIGAINSAFRQAEPFYVTEKAFSQAPRGKNNSVQGFSFIPYHYAVWYKPKTDQGLVLINTHDPQRIMFFNAFKFNALFSIFILVWILGGLYVYRLHNKK